VWSVSQETLCRSSSSGWFAGLSKETVCEKLLKKVVASFRRKVYWFAPFGALASTGCRLMDLNFGRSSSED
jgi:hypothetical protein